MTVPLYFKKNPPKKGVLQKAKPPLVRHFTKNKHPPLFLFLFRSTCAKLALSLTRGVRTQLSFAPAQVSLYSSLGLYTEPLLCFTHNMLFHFICILFDYAFFFFFSIFNFLSFSLCQPRGVAQLVRPWVYSPMVTSSSTLRMLLACCVFLGLVEVIKNPHFWN